MNAPRRGLIHAVVVIALATLVCGVEAAVAHRRAAPDAPAAERRDGAVPIGNFALVDQSGRPFELKQVRGKVVVASFAYTTCTDVCPLLTSSLRLLQENLSPRERDAVHLLTVTTDPEIDRPAVLASYAKRYGADLSNWSFLTGTEHSLRPVWKNFGVSVRKRKRGLIDHTPLTAVLDQDGTMRVAFHGAAPSWQIILGDVRRLLAR